MENCDSKGFKLLRIVNNKKDSKEFFQSLTDTFII
jgi:hypothetical protein